MSLYRQESSGVETGKVGMRDYRFLIRKSSDQRDRPLIITLIKIVAS